MADTEDFKGMILAFRVSELQVLLGFAGRNKSGRKEQLQVRALELLKLRSAPIQMKIRELNKRHPVVTKPSAKAEPVQSIAATNIIRRHSPRNQPQVAQTMKPTNHYRSTSSSGSGNVSGNGNVNNSGSANVSGSAVSGQTHGHTTSSSSRTTSSSSSSSSAAHHSTPLDFSSKYSVVNPVYPVHPDVKLRKLPFYQVIAELLKPASLVPSGSSRFQETNFVFHLTPQQAHDIAISRDFRPGAKMEYTNQVQMRFCLLETSCEQDDNFPPSICVKVNSKMCPLPNPIPTNKPGVEPKRPSRPVNITCLCKLSPTVTNIINVSWASEYGRGYTVAVYLVKRLTSANLIHKLKAAGIRNADHTRALIKEKLAHDADSEIATTSLRVSLMCPLGKMRMQIPCRAITCTHLQCFDASLYIQMNEKKPTWMCPVCDKLAPFDALVVDGLFMEIFTTTSDCNEIQFHDNGSWSPMQPKKELHMIASSLDSASKTKSSVAACSNASGSIPKVSAAKFEVVDLTCDTSSDDDYEPPRKSPALSLPSPAVSSSSQSLSTVLSLQSANSGQTGASGGVGAATRSDLGRNNSSSSHSSPAPAFRDMAVIDSSSSSSQPQLYYPPVSSPYAEFLQSTNAASLFNYPGYDLFNLLGQTELDRQVPSYGLSSMQSSSSMTLPTSHRSSTAVPPASPDVISLD